MPLIRREKHTPPATSSENVAEITQAEAKDKRLSLLETEKISKTSPMETGDHLSRPGFEAGEKLVETGGRTPSSHTVYGLVRDEEQ